MTRSEIFSQAHAIAKMTVNTYGCYRTAFSCALRIVYAGMRVDGKKIDSCSRRKSVSVYTVQKPKANTIRVVKFQTVEAIKQQILLNPTPLKYAN